MTHQQKQIEVIDQIESQVKSNRLKSSLVTPVKDFEKDPRICLTSVHIPSNALKQKIQDEIIRALKGVFSEVYFYSSDSMHMTVKNIRVINNPPHFKPADIEKAKQVFSQVIPKHKKFKAYFYRLLLFPNNLALMSTTDPELDSIVFDLDKGLNEAELPDDKQYINSKYFFCNMTLARFSTPSKEFIKKVEELTEKIKFDPYIVDSVSLITCNAVLKDLNIIGTWKLK
ncbi:MAG: hypothetical protein Q7R49_00725 [Candidatus Daviesbacteria bacterium]|nr:hypothetical protein [Candidatus Daviesbacteria bacterium]